MKIINSVVVLIILVCGIKLSHGEELDCEFGELYYPIFGWLYSCKVTSLDNPYNNLTIEGYSGEHKANMNDANVKLIWIRGTNTKYIPTNLESLFNLTMLSMHRTQLVEIKTKDFHGMHDLESLSLDANKLTSVPLDAFTTLTKLKYIFLSYNQIEELPNGIFEKNLELERIHLNGNKIKYLGTEIFNNLNKLNWVDLEGNICVNKYYIGATKIIQLKKDIKIKCKNPNEVPATTTTTTRRTITTTQNPTTTTTTPRTTTTSTTQNPMEVKLIEMQDKNRKLEKELREAKEQLQTNGDALKKELTVAKELQRKNKAEFNRESRSLNNQLRESKGLQKKCETEAIKERVVKDEMIKMMLLTAFDVQQKYLVEIEKLRTEAKEIQIKCVAETQDLTTKLSKCESMKSSFNIDCKFQMTNGEYSCDARDLVIHQKQMVLNEVSGTHLISNTNENVTELKIANSSMLFWPNDIFKTFSGLQTLVIQNAQLKELSQGDFNSATNLKNLKVQGNVIRVLGDDLFQGAAEHLTNIQMNSNEIVKISTGTFHGLKQLKMLSLKDNLITELQLGTFKDVVMLENLLLSGNKIKFLNGKLFEFNVKLMTLAVDHNELREIGEDILDYSVALEDVNFNGNDCIYQEFKESEVDDLKFNIKHCCKNPEQALNVYNCGHRGWD